MKNMPKNFAARHGTWLAFWMVFIFAGLYSRPPMPIDETRYLSVAWEMWQSGNFLVPHSNGIPYSHKPPLLFWLIHSLWMLSGVSELSARLVAPLFGLAATFLTIRFAQKLWPDRPEVNRAVPYILLGTLVWSLYSSLTMFDTLLTTFVLLSLCSIFTAAQQNTSFLRWLRVGLFVGLGILAKGPVVLIYVAPSMICAPFWVGRKDISWFWWYSGCVFAIVSGTLGALCWALPAASAGGETYANAILFHQTADRLVNSFAHDRPFYWYLVLCPLIFLPWFFWIPAWKISRCQLQEPATRFCLITIITVSFLLSLVSGKQVHYVLPVIPVVALLVGRNLSDQQQSGIVDRFPVFIIMIMLGIAFFILPDITSINDRDAEILKMFPRWLPLIPVGCALCLLFSQKSIWGGVKLISLSIVGLLLALHLSLREPLYSIYDLHDVGVFLEKLQAQNQSVAVFPAKLSDQFQFTGKLSQRLYPVQSRSDLKGWVIAHPLGYSLLFFSKKKDFMEIQYKLRVKYRNGWLSIASNSSLIGFL